jgi:mono/diheme cytochrome c family protein
MTAAAVIVLATGCTPMDNALAAVPVFAFMREAPFFDPYEAPRPAPEGSVPFLSPAGTQLAPTEPTEAGLNAFAASPEGQSIFEPGDAQANALGRTMFDRPCAVCHGIEGRGGATGYIVGPGKYPPLAPNLMLPATVARTDGYLYAIIRAGRGLMPSYGPRTSHRARWAIVNYVRQLQGASGAASPAPADSTAAGRGAAAPGDQ